jgi:hypothetical protein
VQEKLEQLIKRVYKMWKSDLPKAQGEHPDEETLACFFDNRLPEEENGRLRQHLLSCDKCMEAFILNFTAKSTEIKNVPEELINRVKKLLEPENKISLLEIALRVKEKALEIINTTGDVLFGQELVPAPILRSRSIKDFKDEVTILKDFNDIRVEAKIENKGGSAFNLIIVIKQKQTHKTIKDLRVTLLKDDLELESRLTDSGAVTFEHVLLGKYTVEISTLENKLALIILDIKV